MRMHPYWLRWDILFVLTWWRVNAERRRLPVRLPAAPSGIRLRLRPHPHRLPAGMHADVKRAFRAVDRDYSGAIDKRELQGALSTASASAPSASSCSSSMTRPPRRRWHFSCPQLHSRI
ncbi:unnamed protein product [Urochloa humidicola]